jgi:dihydroorotase-like cyclic amidohydrolase
VMTPPLRRRDRVERLRELVAAGQVDAMGSDHCGYTLAQRGDGMDFTEASPGIPGTETLWSVVYTTLVSTGLMSLVDALRLVTLAPATVFGLRPRKGAIEVGADADLVLFDERVEKPLDERSLHSMAGYSPWHGRTICGEVVRTIVRGRTVYERGQITGSGSHGEFIPRARWRSRELVHAASG